MTLTEFLLARIAEDEAAASHWPEDGNWGLRPSGDGMWADPLGRPIYGPKARVLAECEAKRRIVEVNKRLGDYEDEFPTLTLRHLATLYADHPDYREEWRP